MEDDLEYQKYLTKVKDSGGWVLEFVPEHLKSPELCNIAVNDGNWVLGFVPEELRTKKLCEIAVEKNGWQLQHVPEEFKTIELCEVAVTNSGWALEFVPEEFKTLELCKYAIEDCLKWNDNLLRKYEFENLFEKYVPVEVQEELAEKYDIELPDKDKGR